jgi:hypothetical protein
MPLAAAQRKAMMPAGTPRSRFLVTLAKRASHAARALGLRRLRGRAKTSRALRGVLYRSFEPDEKPKMPIAIQERLRAGFRDDVRALDALLGSDFQRLWNY